MPESVFDSIAFDFRQCCVIDKVVVWSRGPPAGKQKATIKQPADVSRGLFLYDNACVRTRGFSVQSTYIIYYVDQCQVFR